MRILMLPLLCMTLNACVSERVVLLPSPDGRPSAVELRSGDEKLRLDQPYAEVVLRSGFYSSVAARPEQVRQRYADALAAMPRPASSYQILFESGSETPDEAAMQLLQQVLADIRDRDAIGQMAEILLVGHADRVGDEAANDQLSLRRVEALRAHLLAAGIAAERIEIAGRGEREPLVATQDGVADAKNRRVDLSVR
jgi:outer membrane protein OmpA-like peptidoglycan-associated protein